MGSEELNIPGIPERRKSTEVGRFKYTRNPRAEGAEAIKYTRNSRAEEEEGGRKN